MVIYFSFSFFSPFLALHLYSLFFLCRSLFLKIISQMRLLVLQIVFLVQIHLQLCLFFFQMQLLLVLFIVQRDLLLLKAYVVVPIFSQVRPSAVIFVLDPKAPYATIVVLGPERPSLATITCGPERRFFPVPFLVYKDLVLIFLVKGYLMLYSCSLFRKTFYCCQFEWYTRGF